MRYWKALKEAYLQEFGQEKYKLKGFKPVILTE
jgi:hypothetical protein